MRILYAGPFPYRSILNRIENTFFLDSLIQKAVDYGHEVIILTTAADIETDVHAVEGQVTLHVCKVGKHGNLRALNGFKNEIRRMEAYIREEDRKTRIDVMHAHWCYEYADACLRVDIDRTLVTLHDWPDSVCPMFHSFYWMKKQTLGNNVLAKAKYFTSVSPYIDLLLNKRLADVRHWVVPNSISLKNDQGENHVRQEASVIRFLAVNTGFSERKNATALIRAFQLFRQKHAMATLVLCGDDYQCRGPAEQWCHKNSISTEGIVFVGRKSQEELIKLYHESDVLIHASLEESFGLILIEAMKNGCAIIAGEKSGAVPWVLESGKAGKLVDVKSPEAIELGMEQMLDFETRQHYVQNGYRRVQCFDTNIVLPLYFDVYERMMG